MGTSFNSFTDVWTLLYAPPEPPILSMVVTKPTTADEDVVAVATSLQIPTSGVWGVKLRNATETVRLYMGDYLAAAPTGSIQVPVKTAPLHLALAWSEEDGVATGRYSLDDQEWTTLEATAEMSAVPTHAELFYEQFSVAESISVSFGKFRALAGTLHLPAPRIEKTFAPIGAAPVVQPPALTPSQIAVIHALVGAQFGDLEFDVGKSVRWTQWFTDDVFITDVNYGTQRFWIIDWTKSFPEVNFKTSGASYFADPVAFRKQQFADASQFARDNPNALVFDNEDWVLFVDAHEALSVDNTPPFPNDYDFDLFRSYVVREIEAANAAGRSTVTLPFFVHVRHDNIQNVQYDWEPEPARERAEGGPEPRCAVLRPISRFGPIGQSLGAPQSVFRLVEHRPTIGADRWYEDPGRQLRLRPLERPRHPEGHTGVPDLNAENDLGWRQRKLLSQVRPIPGLPHGETWQFPDDDDQGLAGPWALETFEDQVTGMIVPEPRPPIAPAVAGVRTPLYDTVLRLNLRDGVWYAGDGTGNTPLDWDDATQPWVPAVPSTVPITP